MAQDTDVMTEMYELPIDPMAYNSAMDIDPMYDVFHPNVFSTSVSDIESMEFCKSHLDALNYADLVYTFVEPYVRVATQAEKDIYKYCKKCRKYCPGEMFTKCKSGMRAACIICSGEYGIIPSDIYENMRSVNNKIDRRRAYYKTRLNSYTCKVCNETFTYNNIAYHNTSKKHMDVVKQQDTAKEAKVTKDKLYDTIIKQEAEINSLKAYKALEEQHDHMEKLQKQRISMLEDNIDHYRARLARKE